MQGTVYVGEGSAGLGSDNNWEKAYDIHSCKWHLQERISGLEGELKQHSWTVEMDKFQLMISKLEGKHGSARRDEIMDTLKARISELGGECGSAWQGETMNALKARISERVGQRGKMKWWMHWRWGYPREWVNKAIDALKVRISGLEGEVGQQGKIGWWMKYRWGYSNQRENLGFYSVCLHAGSSTSVVMWWDWWGNTDFIQDFKPINFLSVLCLWSSWCVVKVWAYSY